MTQPGHASEPDWAWTGQPVWTAPEARGEKTSTGAIVGAVFLGIWLVLLAVMTQLISWFASQLLLAVGLELPGYVWPITGVVILLFGGGPALLLALIPKSIPVRETGRAWAIGAGALALGTGLRALPELQNAWYLIALALSAGVAAFVLRRQGNTASVNAAWAAVAGLIVLVPFLWFGALGGWLETLLAIAAAIAVGSLAASTMDSRFWAAFESSRVKRVLLGGLIAGVTLALIAGGAGANGAQLLMLLVLPPLGFAAAALRHVRWLVALAALGPLAFFDPVEINIFLGFEDVPFWAFVSAALAWLIAAVLGLAYGLAEPLLSRVKRPVAAGVATAVALGAGAVYLVGGQPGFFGDQLFVVLKDQASLTGLPLTTGVGPQRDERVRQVYQRLVEHADRTQAPLRADLDRLNLSYQPYYLVNGIMVSGGPEVRAWLELRGDVDRILVDQRVRPLPRDLPQTTGDIREAPSTPLWNIEMVGAPDVWRLGARGSGIVVGSSDSGAEGTHPALAPGYRGGSDSWFDPWNGTTSPVDNGGHGTHTLATAVGKKNVGVAPDAQWIACVNLDRNMASPSLYLDCLQFMLAPFPHGGDPFRDGNPARAPHVLTNSWGCPAQEGCDVELTRPATNALAAAGIAFVAAAGNEGDRCGSIDDPPATDPAAFTVAAVNENAEITVFSSRGKPGSGKPDIAAPGQDILSAMPGGTYGLNTGTSMATPHIAGVIALMWSAEPALVGDLPATYSRIKENANPVTGVFTCGDEETQGAGLVDAPRAVFVGGE